MSAKSPAPTSGFQQYLTLVKKDLRMEFRTREMLTSMVVYAVLVLTIYGAAVSQSADSFDILSISSGLLWALIVFTSLLGLNRSFSHEIEGACLDALLLAPMERSVIFFAKATSNLIFLLLVEIVVIPLFLVMFLSSASLGEHAPLMVLPILIGTIGVAAVGTLLSTITINTRGKDVLLAILFIPVIFPLLYACVASTSVVLLGIEGSLPAFWRSLALAGGYDVVMSAAAWMLYEFAVTA